MSVSVRIHDGPLRPLPTEHDAGTKSGRAGARVAFEGIVRDEESGSPIRALCYEVYEPMASRMLTSLAEEIAAARGLLAMHVEHSRGEVPVGACSFRLIVHAAHRQEALAAMDDFISRMKADVPIWKVAVCS